MTVANELVTSSEVTLSGNGMNGNRMACWLARSALEEVVGDLLDAKGYPAGEATMRTRLTCLQVACLECPEIPARAQYAWSRLSEACHQHAFRLSPTYSEAAHLLDLVRSLIAVSAGMRQQVPPPRGSR